MCYFYKRYRFNIILFILFLQPNISIFYSLLISINIIFVISYFTFITLTSTRFLWNFQFLVIKEIHESLERDRRLRLTLIILTSDSHGFQIKNVCGSPSSFEKCFRSVSRSIFKNLATCLHKLYDALFSKYFPLIHTKRMLKLNFNQ